jgi:hypothetical protein
MLLFVMPNTARDDFCDDLMARSNKKGGALATMTTENDIGPLLELMKMEAAHWRYSGTGEVSQDELFRRDQFLLEMWPEACRRTGVGTREFPSEVIKLWKGGLGRPN